MQSTSPNSSTKSNTNIEAHSEADKQANMIQKLEKLCNDRITQKEQKYISIES